LFTFAIAALFPRLLAIAAKPGIPEKIYVLAALIMSNIVLNNYSKNKKNACQHEKRSTKKKLTTLNN
jgi:hypothetical protein